MPFARTGAVTDISIYPEVFYKKEAVKDFLKFTENHLCYCVFFNKDTMAQMYSYELCAIFIIEHLWWLLLH